MSNKTQADSVPFIPMRVAASGICSSVGNSTAAASAAIRARMSHFQPGEFYDSAGEIISLAKLYEVPLWGQQRLQHMYRAAMIAQERILCTDNSDGY